MTKSTTVIEVEARLEEAVDADALSMPVKEIIVNNLNSSTAALAATQATVESSKLGATEGTIIVFVLDASSSMHDVEDDVRNSVFECVEATKESKGSEFMTLSLIQFNDNVQVAFANTPVDLVSKGKVNYRTGGMTAMYDGLLTGITGALDYEEQLISTGRTTKVIIVGFTDGADNNSTSADAKKINQVVTDIQAKRENWVFALVGFKTWGGVDYKQVAKECGFPALLEIDLSGDEYDRRHAIRDLFMMVSESLVETSANQIDPNTVHNNFFSV